MLQVQPTGKRCRAHRVTVLFLAVAMVWGTAASAALTDDQTDARIASALQGLQRFHSSHSLDDLKASVGALTSAVDMPTIKPENYVARRRAVVRAWAQVLGAIERSYDPTFDPNNPNNTPEECLGPPREASGMQLPSCADPNDVQDPVARAAYIAALAANDLKIKRMTFYRNLHNIDDGAMLSLRMNLDSFRRVMTPSDSAALDRILRQAGLSDARRTEIDAMF